MFGQCDVFTALSRRIERTIILRVLSDRATMRFKEVVIAAGVRAYRFYPYSEAETEWRLGELSEWANIPILKYD